MHRWLDMDVEERPEWKDVISLYGREGICGFVLKAQVIGFHETYNDKNRSVILISLRDSPNIEFDYVGDLEDVLMSLISQMGWK